MRTRDRGRSSFGVVGAAVGAVLAAGWWLAPVRAESRWVGVADGLGSGHWKPRPRVAGAGVNRPRRTDSGRRPR